MRRPKVSIWGAGGTGVKTAEAICAKGNVDVVLIDVLTDVAKGRALDIAQTRGLSGTEFSIVGGDNPELTRDSDIVVVTAGKGRRPGISRESLLAENARIVKDIAQTVRELCPNAFIIVLTNPADLLTKVAYTAAGFPSHRVLGQGGVLDSARMSVLIAEALSISVSDVRAMVLGGHGDSMVPVREFVSVHGVPAHHLLNETQWNEIIQRTRFGGGEILSLFRTHGAAATPGLAVAQMVEALMSPVPRFLPISTLAQGEYGIVDTFIGLPALVSSRGVEKIVELPLPEDALCALQSSATTLQQAWDEWVKADGDVATV